MKTYIRCAAVTGLLLPVLAGAFTPFSLSAGWNLVGNSDPASIDVAVRLNKPQISTVWKWNKVSSKWAFYTPSMTSAQLAAYASGKGYDVLTSIDSKEGYWVNASAALVISDPLDPPPTIGTTVTLMAADLVPGWNLMGSADKKTPTQLNGDMLSSLNAASKAINTLWAWDAASSGWRFYAPSLEAQGGTVLANYITGKNYLPFTSVLASTDGFWVNIGTVTAPVVNPPSPSANLRTLTFTSANDWYLKVSSSTAAQNTPATDGSTRYRFMNTAKAAGGAPYSWTTGSTPMRGADVHWNGTSWANCPINFENTSSAKDASGNTTYNYCNGRETGSSVGNTYRTVDISARPMIDVYNEALAGGNTNLTITSAASVLGSATFPAGSKVSYNTYGSNYLTSIAYYPGSSNLVLLSDAGVASGNSTSCNANPSPASSPNATLEQLVAINKGTPCVYGVNTVTGANGVTLTSGSRNEGWSSTTLSLGSLGSAPTYSSAASASSWYTTNTRLRVGFGAVNAVTFYSCKESYGGSTRNCDAIGTGTYAIQALGDGRVMTFSGFPAQFTAIDWSRVFVERAGRVFYGYQDKPVVGSPQARLNLTALNALFGTLGLPAFNPDTPIVLSLGSYSGSYSGTFMGTDSGTFSTTINPSGATTCSGTSTQSGAFLCSFSVTPTGTDGTIATVNMGITGTGAVFTGTANYYTGAVTGSWTNTGGAGGAFAGSRQ
jgi:hypothetical protein